MSTRSKKFKKAKQDANCSSSPQTVQIDPLPSQRTRAKKYSKEESDALLVMCSEFHSIINKNSNSDADKKIKGKAWATIKHKFDAYCQTEGIYVSIMYSDRNSFDREFVSAFLSVTFKNINAISDASQQFCSTLF